MLRSYYSLLGIPDYIPEDIIDQLFPNPEADEPKIACTHDFVLADTGYTCKICGIVDVDRLVTFPTRIPTKNHHLYKRNHYFIEKMRLLAGIKQTVHPNYAEMINFFKELRVTDDPNFKVHDLRLLMKKNGYSKFYKYINSIWFDLTRQKLIDLTYHDIKVLSFKFLQFERKLKRSLNGRINFPNYNTIIYVFLKMNGYQFYVNIILPKNQRKIIEIIEKYC